MAENTIITLFLGGILNQTFFGIPYYMWIMVALMILAILIVGVWYIFIWWPTTPYHGILWATVKKTGASMVFDENMHFDLITERSSKVIFNETFKSAQEAEEDKTEAPAATIGSVRVDFIFDPDKWTYPNSYQHKIIEDVAIKWNDANPTDQIRTLMKFAKYLDAGELDIYADDMKNLKKTYVVPWSRVKMMYKDREESGTFGFIMSLAQTIEKIESGSLNGYAILILAFFGLIDIVLIAAHYIG